MRFVTRWARRRGGDRGFVTVWTVAAAFACLSVVGLSYEGGASLRDRSNAFGAASAAARAGTQALDERHAVEHGAVRLDETEAVGLARQHLAAWGVDVADPARWDVTVANDAPGGPQVTVTVRGGAPFRLIPGSHRYTISATARVEQVSSP